MEFSRDAHELNIAKQSLIGIFSNVLLNSQGMFKVFCNDFTHAQKSWFGNSYSLYCGCKVTNRLLGLADYQFLIAICMCCGVGTTLKD